MISIVIPAYNEEKTLYQNIIEIINHVDHLDYELILVDDGSKDETWNIITKLKEKYKNIKGIKFSRNFGKEAALLAGVTKASGDAVITMDSDLQHPPKYIKDMILKWQDGYKIIECVKKKRTKESLIYKLCAAIFYKTMQKLTGVDMENGGDYKLMDRKVVNEVIKLKDSGLFFRGMVNFVGFKTYKLKINIEERKGDTTKFNFKSLTNLALNGVTSFSNVPLTISIKLGVLSMILGIILYDYNPETQIIPSEIEEYVLPQGMQEELDSTIKEAEKQSISSEFEDKDGELMVGTLSREDQNNYFVDLGRCSGILPKDQIIPGEKLVMGSSVKVYVSKLEIGPKGPFIMLSRSHYGFVKRLLEIEIPELADGTIMLYSVARDAGSRTKIAVYTEYTNVDPLGAVIGEKGRRIRFTRHGNPMPGVFAAPPRRGLASPFGSGAPRSESK